MKSRLEQMRRECTKFHKAHPELWALFVGFAFDKIRLGHKHYGAKAVMERVRWETSAGDSSPEFKVNNNFPSFYARRFSKAFPDHEDFFRTRVQKSAASRVRS